MLVAGVDVGSLSSKCLLMEDGRIIQWSIMLTGPDSVRSAKDVAQAALERAGLTLADLDYTVGTGYGRVNVPFAEKTVTEITCHAKGCHWYHPDTRTVLDMGGQDCKAIRCDENGNVTNFIMNDKCAAGTGRYMERVAATLQLKLEDIGPMSLRPENGPLAVSDFCAVFAEGDIVQYVNEDKPINDILAGAHEAILNRIVALLQRVGVEEKLQISGGVAKNSGIVSRLEERLGMGVLTASEPQIVGALGAAIYADQLASRGVNK